MRLRNQKLERERRMKYNLSLPLDVAKADARYEALKRQGRMIELTDKSTRSKAQNSYEHLIMGIVAMEVGVTLEYCKEYYFKRLVNPDIFVRKVDDPIAGEIVITRSTRELSVEETAMAIDRFKRWCYEQGYYIPDPADQVRLLDIEMQMGRMEQFIGI